jgi:hypothetical protein
VLKGCDDPYFSLNSTKAFIKLKKDYIAGLGDTADFAIVGVHYPSNIGNNPTGRGNGASTIENLVILKAA